MAKPIDLNAEEAAVLGIRIHRVTTLLLGTWKKAFATLICTVEFRVRSPVF